LIIKVAIALSLILTVFGIYSYDSYKTAEAERLRLEKIAEEEENRISTALAEPSLYWKMTYSAPYKEGYSAKDTAYYANGGVVKGYICVLVGVNLMKDTSSSYYLDNTIDQGKANFRTTDFTLNNQNPWIPIGRENYCAKAFKGFRIVDTYEFDEYQNQPFFLLFIIDVNDKQNSQFSWKDKVITTLPDLFSK
jgi:hypothetical protein